MVTKLKVNSDSIISLILSVFVIVLLVDPTSTMLKIKDIVFLMLIAVSAITYTRIKTDDIMIILIIYLIVIISFIFGYLSLYNFDFRFTFGVVKGLSPIILLLWIDKYRIIKKMVFPSLLVCCIVIGTFLALKYKPTLANNLHLYFVNHSDTLMIARRTFLGIEIISLFYKSLPILLIPVSIYTYKFFNTKGEKLKNFVIMSLFLFTLFLGGTRASILAEIVIIAFNFFLWLYRSDLGKLVMIPILVASVTIFGILFFFLVSEKEESSNKVKFANLESYSDLMIKHPSILVLGQGAGSKFYSKGRNAMVVQTEWSYIEILRMFGLFGASVVIVLFLFPLYIFYKKRKVLLYWIPVFIGYLLYLFVGGTNPLLLGSTGMLVLLGAYSYARNPYYEINKW
jgi:hypothetical protein